MAKGFKRRSVHAAADFPFARILSNTRSGNSKYLYEMAHKNPLWVNPVDARKLGDIRTGDLLKVHTEIGFFVLHAW